MAEGELILYNTEDGAATVGLRSVEGTVWLSQLEMATLFDTSKQNVSLHINNILSEKELLKDSVVKDSLTTAADGKLYRTKVYNLDAILAVGYRVRSPRGVQFRRWATTVLRDYLVKGFTMDDARLKQAERWDYFDEWLARIRDIRASEKRFCQKVRDLYTTAVDYDKISSQAQEFGDHKDPASPTMGLTSWKGNLVRKGDVGTAKNYLKAEEVEELNRIVVMYLDYAEDQAQRRRPVTMAEWGDSWMPSSPSTTGTCSLMRGICK